MRQGRQAGSTVNYSAKDPGKIRGCVTIRVLDEAAYDVSSGKVQGRKHRYTAHAIARRRPAACSARCE